MNGDIPAAALRLLSSCPVRTHERPPPKRDSANHVRECVIGGVRYASIAEAARQIGCHTETLRKRIKAGNTTSAPRTWGGSNRMVVFVGDERFDSMTAATRALGCSLKTLNRMIADGRARLAGKHE